MRANGFPICPLNNESEWAELDGGFGEVLCVCVCVCVCVRVRAKQQGDWCGQEEDERLVQWVWLMHVLHVIHVTRQRGDGEKKQRKAINVVDKMKMKCRKSKSFSLLLLVFHLMKVSSKHNLSWWFVFLICLDVISPVFLHSLCNFTDCRQL